MVGIQQKEINGRLVRVCNRWSLQYFSLNVFIHSLFCYVGFDVDFCKAVSAAIFDGVTSSVLYIDLPATTRFQALQNGDVDVLSRLTTVTLARDVLEPNTAVGFSFSQPNFYDGLTFGGIPPCVSS